MVGMYVKTAETSGKLFVYATVTTAASNWLPPPPQGDRPLPAAREAGPWAPAFGGAGLGRLGEWRPPGPSRFCFFFLSCSLLLCGTAEPCD